MTPGEAQTYWLGVAIGILCGTNIGLMIARLVYEYHKVRR